MECLQHAGGAAIVPVLPDNSVVLIQQYRYCVGDTIWEIPAGRLEPGENPLECAKRELREEVGYEAGQLCKIAEIYSTPAYCDEIITIYRATDLTPGEQQLDCDEIIEVVTIPLNVAVEKIKAGEIKDAKTVVGLLSVKL
jgi:ADP-ribose pyrophosphatase